MVYYSRSVADVGFDKEFSKANGIESCHIDMIYFSKALNISDLKKGWFWATEKDLKGNVKLNFDNSNNAKIQDDVKYFGLKCIELRRKYGN